MSFSASSVQATDLPVHPFPPLAEQPEFDVDAWFETSELLQQSENQLLEVVVSWQGGILDIGHYQTPRRLTFGTDHRADFCYPLNNRSKIPGKPDYFSLIEPAKSGFLLCFDTEMDGTIEQNGERFTFLELISAGRAHHFNLNKKGKCYFPLTAGTKVSLDCNGLQIHIRFVPAPQFHAAFFRRLDHFSTPVLSFSVLAQLLVVVLALTSNQSTEESNRVVMPQNGKNNPPAIVFTGYQPEKGLLQELKVQLPPVPERLPTMLGHADEHSPPEELCNPNRERKDRMQIASLIGDLPKNIKLQKSNITCYSQ